MKLATVVNIDKGEGYDVYCGRPGRGHAGIFGNPFGRPSLSHSRAEAIAKHKNWFHQRCSIDLPFLARVLALRGKRLGCFCAPRPCHADTIAEFVNTVEENAALDPVMPGPMKMPFACPVCTALLFTQIPSRHTQCQTCGRWYCPSHLLPGVHACPGPTP